MKLLVIGSGIGGLSATIHGRLAGYETSVISKGPIGGKAAPIHVEGYRLDPGPSIVILPDLYRELFRQAGKNLEDYLQFQRLDPISRVCFEGEAPLDLPANRKQAENLVDTLSPKDGAAFRNLLEILDDVSPLVQDTIFDHAFDKPWQLAHPKLIQMALKFDVRASYRELVDRWFQSPLLRAFFYGFPSYGGQTYDSKAPGALLIPYLMLEGGVYYPVGGVAAIPKALESLARDLGVQFESGEVTSIETEGSEVRKVITKEGKSLKADSFVCNLDRYTAGTWFGRNHQEAPSLSYFTVHYGFAKKLTSTAHHTLLIPKDFERGFEELYREGLYPQTPIVYLNDTTISDPSVAPEGHTNLFAVVTSPADNGKVDWTDPQWANSLRKQLDQFNIVEETTPSVFERIQTPLTFAARDGNYRGSLYGVEESKRLFGMLPEGPRDPQYKNWTYAGGTAQPGAGMPMVLLSGKFAINALERA